MVRADQLQQMGIGAQWVDPLNETFARFNINSAVEQAAFIGQCGHECNNFKTLEENLNYRAATLMKMKSSSRPMGYPAADAPRPAVAGREGDGNLREGRCRRTCVP